MIASFARTQQAGDAAEDAALQKMLPERTDSNIHFLRQFIKGDLFHCIICNKRYTPDNKPRVLFCGDCLCDHCVNLSSF